MNKRSLPVTFLLLFFTCGFYFLYLIYALSKETNELTQDYRNDPALDLLLSIVTCGLYSIYWFYKIGKQIENYEYDLGMRMNSISLLCTILSLFPTANLVGMMILVNEMNSCIDEKENF